MNCHKKSNNLNDFDQLSFRYQQILSQRFDLARLCRLLGKTTSNVC